MKTIGRSEHNFDRVARAYRWLEYLTFGPLLQRIRIHFLGDVCDRQHALLFGDGDGRFTAQLLSQNPNLVADAVDTSARMLLLLERRSHLVSNPATSPGSAPATPRLRTYHQSAITFIPDQPPDLVVTHFFLDCLTQTELDTFVLNLTPHLTPDAVWLLSDFQIPSGAFRIPARLLVRGLYLCFKLLTGLRVTNLPVHAPTLAQAGFVRLARHHRLFGTLVSELWQRQEST